MCVYGHAHTQQSVNIMPLTDWHIGQSKGGVNLSSHHLSHFKPLTLFLNVKSDLLHVDQFLYVIVKPIISGICPLLSAL